MKTRGIHAVVSASDSRWVDHKAGGSWLVSALCHFISLLRIVSTQLYELVPAKKMLGVT